ncbi:MAG: glycoside hydrolase 43 family protein [Sphingomonas sp.]
MAAATCLFMVAAPAQAQATYTNPILYADYSDPDVIRVGTDYYLVASSFHFSPGIPVLRSRDLVHWTIIGHVLPKLPFGPLYDMPGPHTLDDGISKPIGGTKYASGVWAPSIRHHDGKFWVYWATPDEGVFMATAVDPAGPWEPAVQVIAQAGLEDPCPYWDEDGSAWLVHGKVGAGPLILHRMAPDGRSVLDAGVLIAEDRINLPVLEGPKLLRRNGWYYIFAPIGGVGTGPQAVGRARRIAGPYEWRVVLEPGTTPIQGPHQGGYVETPSGQGWFAHFNSTGAFGRIVHLQPVVWKDDWPIIGRQIPDRTAGQPVASFAMPDTGNPPTADRLQASDEFSAPALGLQWSWNHNPDDGAWSLSARPGWLRLQALAAQQIVAARNTLTQILQGPASTVTARIDLGGMAEGQRAGLSLFGVRAGVDRRGARGRAQPHHALVRRRRDAGPRACGQDHRAPRRSERRAERPLFVQHGRQALHARRDPIWLSRFSWWKGSRPALFSFTRGQRGWIDVDWVHVEIREY